MGHFFIYLFDKITEDNISQFSNALSSIFVTPSEIVTSTNAMQPENGA